MTDLWKKRELICEFTLLDLKTRYKGAALGILWSLLQPLALLAVYVFLFRVILKPRWSYGPGVGGVENILILFCGIIVFNVLGECLTRAPLLIVSYPNYVKKAVFPVEILPVCIVGSALMRLLISLGVLLAGMAAWGTWPSAGAVLLLPLFILPLLFFTLGLSWAVTALGIFFRDLAHVMPFVVQLLFFLTPILYPTAAVPEAIRSIFKLNIMSLVVEGSRDVLFFGRPMEWAAWSAATLAASCLCAASYACFMKGKALFADAL